MVDVCRLGTTMPWTSVERLFDSLVCSFLLHLAADIVYIEKGWWWAKFRNRFTNNVVYFLRKSNLKSVSFKWKGILLNRTTKWLNDLLKLCKRSLFERQFMLIWKDIANHIPFFFYFCTPVFSYSFDPNDKN